MGQTGERFGVRRMIPDDCRKMAAVTPNAEEAICPQGNHMALWDSSTKALRVPQKIFEVAVRGRKCVNRSVGNGEPNKVRQESLPPREMMPCSDFDPHPQDQIHNPKCCDAVSSELKQTEGSAYASKSHSLSLLPLNHTLQISPAAECLLFLAPEGFLDLPITSEKDGHRQYSSDCQ